MRAGRLDQVAGACGIAFAALSAINHILLTGSRPLPGAGAGALTEYFGRHHSAILAQTYLSGLAAIFFLAFLAALWSALREVESGPGTGRTLVLAGGAVAAALALASQALLATLASPSVLGSPGATRALFTASAVLTDLSWFPLAALAAGVTLVAVQAEVFPPVLRWSGAAVAALALVAPLGLFSETRLLLGLNEAAFAVFTLWVMGIGAALMLRPTGLSDAERAALLQLERIGR